jgi:hypothetical protein
MTTQDYIALVTTTYLAALEFDRATNTFLSARAALAVAGAAYDEAILAQQTADRV